jgi:outer membrane receptor protein involved in Fe transport
MYRILLPSLSLLAAPLVLAQDGLEEILVTGEFREAPLDTVPASISVITAEALERRAARHLDEALPLAANVNVAGGSSRSRFFQIRGIGERGQFSEPLNPSVGLIVDGVDLSTAATAAALSDVEQIEVFRGPQGTRYGANALAGLINVRTREPSRRFESRVGLETANYDAATVSGMISGPVTDRVALRLSAQQHGSDGFIENTFLGREDTNERDELAVRGKLRWDAGDALTVDAALGYVEIDNGYDAFSLDNDRYTRSDEPGRDAQDTVYGSLALDYDSADAFSVEGSLSSARSDSLYSYDEDWTYDGFHPLGYASTDSFARDRDTTTGELRLLSKETGRLFDGTTDWVLGLYTLRSNVDLVREYTFLAGPFASRFDVDRTALFGQVEALRSERTRLTAGLRYERHSASYDDSAGVSFSPDDDLLGWRLSVDRDFAACLMGYVTLSRGYKAGGFNTDGTLDEDLRQYEPETLVNLEVGIKGSLLDGRLDARLTLFHMLRDDVQIASSTTRLRENGSTEFIDFIGNAAEGTNTGIEAELVFVPNERLDLRASVGVLESKYESFVNAAGQNLDGREQAHAPGYQFALSVRRAVAERWYVDLGIEGRDAFYFSDSHGGRSRSYETVNAAVGFELGPWEARLWARNLTDEDTFIRGYFFGNDPRDGYLEHDYTQFGEPRRVGVGITRAFR